MKLSMKTDYALRALLDLAAHCGEGPIPIRELAERNDVPRRFLEQIMIDLKGEGWVRSVPGRYGGYALARTPEDITIGQVVRHFDGVLAPIGCVSVFNCQHCSQEGFCRFRKVLLEIRNFTALLADRATLASVCEGRPVVLREAPEIEWAEGAGI